MHFASRVDVPRVSLKKLRLKTVLDTPEVDLHWKVLFYIESEEIHLTKFQYIQCDNHQDQH